MTGQKALDFVRRDQGEPDGWEWQLPGEPRYQIIDADLLDDSMPYIVTGFSEAVEEAERLDGRFRPVPGPEEAAWGIVIPDDDGEPFQFLPEATPWNGRGRGEPPDGEWSVRLVRKT